MIKNESRKIIIITCDCGVGKSTIFPLLKSKLDPKRYMIHELDEYGVPELTLEWRKQTTNYWIEFSLKHVSSTMTPIVLGMIDPRDVEEFIDKKDFNWFFFIHLDVNKEERLRRLKLRGENREILMKHHYNLISLRSWFKTTPFSHISLDSTNLDIDEYANKVYHIIKKIGL